MSKRQRFTITLEHRGIGGMSDLNAVLRYAREHGWNCVEVRPVAISPTTALDCRPADADAVQTSGDEGSER